MSLIFPFRGLDIPPLPTHLSYQEDAQDRVRKNNNEKDERDLEEKGCREPKISNSEKHPVDLEDIEHV
jgi:hypothetical protein